ncbi:MAG: hypothetical protein GY714_19930 [Desulfobacterales bacterium]|nr:hypothetical protein [Desulfobacterales bacterium]
MGEEIMQKYTKALEKLLEKNECEVKIFKNNKGTFTVIADGFVLGIGEHKQWRRALVLAEKDYSDWMLKEKVDAED